MAMTEEEKKAARREASRKWYAAHKANRKTNRSTVRRRGKAKLDISPDESETSRSSDAKAEETVVAVDPALLTGIENGSVLPRPPIGVFADEYEDDDVDDATRLKELEGIDPDELTDAERDELEELRENLDDDDWYSGRSESLRELEEQGAYDD